MCITHVPWNWASREDLPAWTCAHLNELSLSRSEGVRINWECPPLSSLPQLRHTKAGDKLRPAHVTHPSTSLEVNFLRSIALRFKGRTPFSKVGVFPPYLPIELLCWTVLTSA